MHELSIADAVMRIACEHAAGRSVARVEVRVGHLRQVVPSALAFAWQLVAEGTPVDGAELVIEDVPAVGRCRACGTDSVLDGFPLQCSECASFDLELISGEELQVDSLELDEEWVTTEGVR